VADVVVADMVCGRYGLWPIWYRPDVFTFRYFDTCLFVTWTFGYHLRPIDTWALRYLDISPPGVGRFAPLDEISPPDDDKEVLIVSQITNFQFHTGVEMSREVAKRPKVRNVQVAKRPGGELEK